MNVRVRLSPEETRAQILHVAEEQYRRVGHAKTAVADIAAVLGMSSANIYRFFASKAAINDAICRGVFAEGEAMIEAVVAARKPAPVRLAGMILGIHRFNRARLTEERRMHDMVEAAMSEGWSAIEAHRAAVKDAFARVIAEGISDGAFDPALDPLEAGETVFDLCVGLFHPTLIDQGAGKDQDAEARRVTAYVLRALRAI